MRISLIYNFLIEKNFVKKWTDIYKLKRNFWSKIIGFGAKNKSWLLTKDIFKSFEKIDIYPFRHKLLFWL